MSGTVNISIKHEIGNDKKNYGSLQLQLKTSPISLSSKNFAIGEMFRLEARIFYVNRLINIARQYFTADLLFLDFRGN